MCIVPSRASIAADSARPASLKWLIFFVSAPAREHPAQADDGIRGHVARERVRRVLRERVGLVEDHDVVVGEHAALRRQVRAVQRVVDDEDRSTLRPLTRGFREARLAVAALRPAGTLRPAARHRLPRGVVHLEVELGTVAGGGSLGEATEAFELVPEVAADGKLEQRVGLGRGVQLRPAQIVRAPLQQREREGDAAVRLQRGEILAGQLGLQRDRRRRDHDLQSGRHRRHEIGEALTRTGRGLRQQVVTVFHRVGHRRGEVVLAAALLAAHRGDGRVEHGVRIGPPRHLLPGREAHRLTLRTTSATRAPPERQPGASRKAARFDGKVAAQLSYVKG